MIDLPRRSDRSYVYYDRLAFSFTGCHDLTLALKRIRSQTLWQGITTNNNAAADIANDDVEEEITNKNMAIALQPLLPMIL